MPFTYQYPKADNTASIIAYVVNEDTIRVLLIRRGKEPFAGQLCFPGGFLNPGQETLRQTAARELKEETGIDYEESAFKLEFLSSKPDRDPRGHVIDAVFSVQVTNHVMDSAKAGDDAAAIEIITIPNTGLDMDVNIARTVTKDMAFDHGERLQEFYVEILSDTALSM